ncbi:hypothetical protein V2O64_09005 [Verrucomicrobiaceae bacterium 227]
MIQFPLLDLCEDLPERNAALSLIESREDLGLCFPHSDLEVLFGRTRCLYDRDGTIIQITGFQPKPRFSFLKKLRAIVSPFSVYQIVKVDLEKAGTVEPTDFRDKIQVLLKADPGDLLLQFREMSNWQEGLEKHESFPALFDFVLSGIKPLTSDFPAEE